MFLTSSQVEMIYLVRDILAVFGSWHFDLMTNPLINAARIV
jgi:hypothetical protein